MKFTSILPLCSGTFRFERASAEKLIDLLTFEPPTGYGVEDSLIPGLQAVAPKMQFHEYMAFPALFDDFVFVLPSADNPRRVQFTYIIHYDHIPNAIDDAKRAELEEEDGNPPLVESGAILLSDGLIDALVSEKIQEDDARDEQVDDTDYLITGGLL